MRKILLCLLTIVAAAGLFYAARYLDSTPMDHGYEAREPLQMQDYEPNAGETAADEETEASAVEAATEEIKTEETSAGQAEETVTGENLEAETEPGETESVETVPPYTGTGGERYVLSFAGDCTLGCNLNHTYNGYGFVKTVGEDYDYPFLNFKSYFESDDFTMVNLEGPLCVGGNPAVKEHVFRGSPEYVQILTGSSVEFASLANNHSSDYGTVGYAETKENLEAADISYVERDTSVVVTTESGLTIGIYGAVYYLMEEDVIRSEIATLRRMGVDLVIFAPHWGSENSYITTDEQVKLAHAAIDAGADIVFGTHPHVLQPIEEYNGGVIFYSLGNFVFGGNIYPKDFDTALVQQEIIRESDGSITLGDRTIVPASISSLADRNDYQPTPYEEGSEGYDRVMRKLSGTYTIG